MLPRSPGRIHPSQQITIEPFIPFRGTANGHIQTLLGPTRAPDPRNFPHIISPVPLFDLDQLILRINHPQIPIPLEQAQADDAKTSHSKQLPIVVLLHGLGGSSESPYILRLTAKLNMQGYSVVRFNHRGCADEGLSLAKGIYHAGRIEDIDATVVHLTSLFPGRRLLLVGFSLSANMLLRFLGAAYDPNRHASLAGALAVNPPIDLEACSVALSRRDNFWIDQFFTKLLIQAAQARSAHFPGETLPKWPKKMTLRLFDELYTAPKAGFNSRRDYYHHSSAQSWLTKITIPTSILSAKDDPIIPPYTFANVRHSEQVFLRLENSGGHLGYISRQKTAHGDRRWMDAFVLNWIRAAGGGIK